MTPSLILRDNINQCEQKHSLESDVCGCGFGLCTGTVGCWANKTHNLSMPKFPDL